jgi:biopolymer transport protein ExbD
MAISIQAENNQAVECCEESHDGLVAEINVTPLTDVFLVLLIIFMVASTAMPQARSDTHPGVVVTPRSGTTTPTRKPTPPVLTVTKAGEVFLGQARVDPPRLEEAIRKALADGETETVLLRGDFTAQLGAAVQVMSIARKAGASSIQVLPSPGQSE